MRGIASVDADWFAAQTADQQWITVALVMIGMGLRDHWRYRRLERRLAELRGSA